VDKAASQAEVADAAPLRGAGPDLPPGLKRAHESWVLATVHGLPL
jgi:hypothetical protein